MKNQKAIRDAALEQYSARFLKEENTANMPPMPLFEIRSFAFYRSIKLPPWAWFCCCGGLDPKGLFPPKPAAGPVCAGNC